jgi:phage-related protein
MPTMPSDVSALKNSLSQPGAWVWLLTFALPNNGPVLRFCSNTEDLIYDGQVYRAFNFSVGGLTWNCDGEIPELTMVVTNVAYQIQEYVRDFNGLIGSEVSFVQVNTDYLAEDWDEDLTTLTVVGAVSTWPDIDLTLSVPPPFRYRVPEDRLNPHVCRHAFRTPAGGYTTRCGYAGMDVTSIKIDSPGNPVRVGKTGHPFVNGDVVRIFSVVGISGLAGDYTVTKISDNYFTLDGTNQGNYSGSFTSGKAGYAQCRRIPDDCQKRGMFPGNYSGPLSMRTEGVRYA